MAQSLTSFAVPHGEVLVSLLISRISSRQGIEPMDPRGPVETISGCHGTPSMHILCGLADLIKDVDHQHVWCLQTQSCWQACLLLLLMEAGGERFNQLHGGLPATPQTDPRVWLKRLLSIQTEPVIACAWEVMSVLKSRSDQVGTAPGRRLHQS